MYIRYVNEINEIEHQYDNDKEQALVPGNISKHTFYYIY